MALGSLLEEVLDGIGRRCELDASAARASPTDASRAARRSAASPQVRRRPRSCKAEVSHLGDKGSTAASDYRLCCSYVKKLMGGEIPGRAGRPAGGARCGG